MYINWFVGVESEFDEVKRALITFYKYVEDGDITNAREGLISLKQYPLYDDDFEQALKKDSLREAVRGGHLISLDYANGYTNYIAIKMQHDCLTNILLISERTSLLLYQQKMQQKSDA